MKKRLLNLLGEIAGNISMEWLIRITNQPFLLPVYHLSSDENAPHIKHIYPIRNATLFKEDMDFFLKYYQAVELAEVSKHISGEAKIHSPSFYLSFDDGLREIHDVVAPILKAKGIPATFFINSAFVDNKKLFYRYKASLLIDELISKKWSGTILNEVDNELKSIGIQTSSYRQSLLSVSYDQQNVLDKIAELLNFSFNDFLKTYRPYLTSEQIQSLINDGFTIGAHSVDHPEYRFISLANQLKQTKESVQWLNHHFSMSPRTFAFPFTDFGVSRAFYEKAKQEDIFDFSFGCAGIKEDSFDWHLHRLPIEGDLRSAEALVKAAYSYYLLKKPFGKNRIIRS